jgi:hypothetical protein
LWSAQYACCVDFAQGGGKSGIITLMEQANAQEFSD